MRGSDKMSDLGIERLIPIGGCCLHKAEPMSLLCEVCQSGERRCDVTLSQKFIFQAHQAPDCDQKTPKQLPQLENVRSEPFKEIETY